MMEKSHDLPSAGMGFFVHIDPAGVVPLDVRSAGMVTCFPAGCCVLSVTDDNVGGGLYR